MQLFFFFLLPLFIDLTSLLSQQFFLSTPAKQPGRPGSLCVRTFYLPLFSFFRGHLRVRYQISYPQPFRISPITAYEYLGILYDFFEAPTKHKEDPQVSIHSLERICGYSRLFPQNNALANNNICDFT